LVIKECVVLESHSAYDLNNKIRAAVANNFVPISAAACSDRIRLITMVKYEKEAKL
jgi:hypothetical protein